MLLRKHRKIREALGVAVPVPTDSAAVIEAILEGLITRGKPGEAAFEQLSLDVDPAAKEADRRLELEWQNAADREKRTRTLYAQHTIRPDEVHRELLATREAIGATADVRQFATTALRAYGATFNNTPRGGLVANLAEAPIALREAIGLPAADHALELIKETAATLERTDPVVQAVAAHTLDQALDSEAPRRIAARCAAIRTAAVTRRTTLLLVRLRFHLTIKHDNRPERRLLAEDARLLAFTGTTDQPEWLTDDAAEQLLTAKPDANVSSEQAVSLLTRLIGGLGSLDDELRRIAAEHADSLAATHRRVRDVARSAGSVTVSAQLPVDVLGSYLLLPTATASGPGL